MTVAMLAFAIRESAERKKSSKSARFVISNAAYYRGLNAVASLDALR
jgi:hypothetical protein